MAFMVIARMESETPHPLKHFKKRTSCLVASRLNIPPASESDFLLLRRAARTQFHTCPDFAKTGFVLRLELVRHQIMDRSSRCALSTSKSRVSLLRSKRRDFRGSRIA